MSLLSQLLLNGLFKGCLFGIAAMGFALIFSTTRILHLVHGAVFTATAYSLYFTTVILQWPLSISIALALVVASGFGIVTEEVVYAPLQRRGATSSIMLLSSLGLYIVIVNSISLAFGDEQQILRTEVEPVYQLGGMLFSRIQLVQAATAFVVLTATLLFLHKTHLGRRIRAVRDNPLLCEAMGINLRVVRIIVFVLGSGLAGLAAILQSLDVGMDPRTGMSIFLVSAAAVIVGGVGSFEGPIVGAFVLAFTQSVVIWGSSGRWADAATFGVLIVFLLFRPSGILGKRRRVEEVVT